MRNPLSHIQQWFQGSTKQKISNSEFFSIVQYGTVLQLKYALENYNIDINANNPHLCSEIPKVVAPSGGLTALHTALCLTKYTPKNHTSVEYNDKVALLLSYKADIYAKDSAGRNIFHHAVISSNYDIVKLFVSKLDTKMAMNSKDDYAKTPLMYNLEKLTKNSKQDLDITSVLITNGFHLEQQEFNEIKMHIVKCLPTNIYQYLEENVCSNQPEEDLPPPYSDI